MKKTFGTFLMKSLLTSALVLTVVAFSNVGWSAVAERPQSTAAPKPDNSARGKMRANPGAATLQISDAVIDDSETTTSDTAAENDSESVEPIFVGNKANDFDSVLADLDAPGARDSAADARAEKIRQQREALNNQSNAQSHAISTGANACDTGLRKCMAEKCGADFTKCEKDNETTWENKLESCRSKTTCTAHEYTLLSPEIKADRDINVKMAFYESVLNCGNRYNKCITSNCGENFEKCISKSDGDSAIKKCDNIAKECKQQDNGMPQRVMNIFGTLRTEKTNAIKDDEKRLYELRDLMRKSCEKFGAMFDERTLDCVYTVNFFAGEDGTQMASKKLYAGDAFQCTPNWFGIDVTTFKENAYRLTRSEKAASAAAFGAGVGTAAGLYTSGALTRRIDEKGWNLGTGDKNNDGGTSNNNKGNKCEKTGGTWANDDCTCPAENGLEKSGKSCVCKEKSFTYDKDEKKCVAKSKSKDNDKPKDKCEKSHGTYDAKNNTCTCDPAKGLTKTQKADACECGRGKWDKNEGKCIEDNSSLQEKCPKTGGEWKNNSCSCSKDKGLKKDPKTDLCTCDNSTQVYKDEYKQCVDTKAIKKCENSGGKWEYKNATQGGYCMCFGDNRKQQPVDGQCVCKEGFSLDKNKNCVAKTEKEMCENPDPDSNFYKGKWDPIKKECKCPKKGELSASPLKPEKDTKWLKPELGGRPGESVDVITVLPGVNLNGTIQYSSGGCSYGTAKF